MVDEQPTGVVFPADASGRRSTTAVGRSAVAAALGAVDSAAAEEAAREKDWRTGYLSHFRRLVEVGLGSRNDALSVASNGLDAVRSAMQVRTGDGAEVPIADVFTLNPTRALATVAISGTGEREGELTLPYRGTRLAGAALLSRLDAWAEAGVIEPSAAEAVRTVAANPEWLDLSDRTVVLLGAGAEMGPLRALLRWGATVVAVDLPRKDIWSRVVDSARRGSGTLLAPVPAGERSRVTADPEALAAVAGADLLHELPTVAAWLASLDGRLVLGNYVYADGATNVRLSVALDALSTQLLDARPETALAFLATPTDVFAVPKDAVAQSAERFARSNLPAKLARGTLRTVSLGRLLQPAYPNDADVGISDSLVAQQGPNYALAKRLQRWRACVARDAGTEVSLRVAPPTRTRSVVKNRALAAAYAGAHRFGVEVFDPATSNTLMAALLVHDLRAKPPAFDMPWQDEAFAAAHGGLWRSAYAPRSALGLAALLGLGGARH